MKIIKTERNRVVCELDEAELRRIRRAQWKREPGYDGKKYVEVLVTHNNNPRYSIQKGLFREVFGCENLYPKE